MKIQKSNTLEIGYPSKKVIASLALGVALSTTACTSKPKPQPKEPSTQTSQTQIEEPENMGGIVPVMPDKLPPETNTTMKHK